MAKYIIIRNNNEFFKIAEDIESKNYWVNNFVDLTGFEEISDSDYELVIRNKKTFTETKPFNSALIDVPSHDSPITKEIIEKQLNRLISNIEGLISVQPNHPTIWQTNLNTLKSINLDSLTFPGTGQNWVDFLMENNISVPSSMEF